MAAQKNRPPGWGGGAALECDLAGRRITADDTPPHNQMQVNRICGYTVDASLVVREVAYA